MAIWFDQLGKLGSNLRVQMNYDAGEWCGWVAWYEDGFHDVLVVKIPFTDDEWNKSQEGLLAEMYRRAIGLKQEYLHVNETEEWPPPGISDEPATEDDRRRAAELIDDLGIKEPSARR